MTANVIDRTNENENENAGQLPNLAAQTPARDAKGEVRALWDTAADDEGGRPHILVPLDGSPRAAAALPHALTLARAFEARISLLAVVEPFSEHTNVPSATEQEADERHVTESTAYLESVAIPLRARGLTVTTGVRHGNPAREILGASENGEYSLIVIGTHGRTGLERMRMGSVAQHVVRHAIIPALVVPPVRDTLTHDDAPITGITVPLDGSPLAEAALPIATRIATALSVPLTLFQVIPSIAGQSMGWGAGYESYYYPVSEEMEHDDEEAVAEYLQAVATPLRARGLTVQAVWQRSVMSRAEEIILAYLPPSGIAVMASHGRGGVLRWVLGSTAEAVLDRAPCPILIVRAGATAHTGREGPPALAGQRVG